MEFCISVVIGFRLTGKCLPSGQENVNPNYFSIMKREIVSIAGTQTMDYGEGYEARDLPLSYQGSVEIVN